jgi:hypothetical protein
VLWVDFSLLFPLLVVHYKDQEVVQLLRFVSLGWCVCVCVCVCVFLICVSVCSLSGTCVYQERGLLTWLWPPRSCELSSATTHPSVLSSEVSWDQVLFKGTKCD